MLLGGGGGGDRYNMARGDRPLLVLLQELFVERPEHVQHFLQLGRLGQDGGAEVVRSGALAESGTGHDANTGLL